MEMPNRPLHPRPWRAVPAWLFRLALRQSEPDHAAGLHSKASRAPRQLIPELSTAHAAVITLANAPSGSVCSDALVTLPPLKNFPPVDSSASATPLLIILVLAFLILRI